MAPGYHPCYHDGVTRLITTELDYSRIELSMLSRRVGSDLWSAIKAAASAEEARRITGRTSVPRPRVQRFPIHDEVVLHPERGEWAFVDVDPEWCLLRGWPARCPGAGRLKAAWEAIRAPTLADARRDVGVFIGMALTGRTLRPRARIRDVKCLLRHSSLAGPAREAIQAYVDEQLLLELADEVV